MQKFSNDRDMFVFCTPNRVPTTQTRIRVHIFTCNIHCQAHKYELTENNNIYKHVLLDGLTPISSIGRPVPVDC